MAENQRCPTCDTPLKRPGLCPACLLQTAANTEPDFVDDGSRSGPTLEDLESAFPEYDQLQFLGEGGMGTVFRARHEKLDRTVAIKILKHRHQEEDGFRERFEREARALAQVDHPNIVRVYDFGEASGFPYLVMEYVEGANLRELIKEGHLGTDDALEIIPQVCQALQYAHGLGIVHRDIKPENILIDVRGHVRIADFGLVKIGPHAEEGTRLTATDQVMGTPHYMAPEQVEHPADVDHRADIFSLGVVFYEMLTGELPLGSFEPPSRRRPGNTGIDRVVLRALEKDPDRRYQQASEVSTELDHLDGTPATASPRTSRSRARTFLVAAGVIAVTILGAWIADQIFDLLELQQLQESRAETRVTKEREKATVALITAATVGDLTTVRKAVADGANVNGIPDRFVDGHLIANPRYALGRAAMNGHVAIVEWLLEHGANPDLVQVDFNDRAIHLAITSGGANPRLIELLTEAGADTHAAGEGLATALNLAVTGNHWDAVQVLARAARTYHDISVLNGTLPFGDHQVQGGGVLHIAVAQGRTEVVRTLLAAGADPQVSTNTRVLPDITPLSLAAKLSDPEILEALLEKVPRVRSVRPAYNAARLPQTAILRLLLARNAPINGSVHGTTPLMVASMRGSEEAVRMLLEAGANSSTIHPSDHLTARGFAEKGGHSGIVKILDEYR